MRFMVLGSEASMMQPRPQTLVQESVGKCVSISEMLDMYSPLCPA